MNIRITSITRHKKRFSTSNTKVKARTTLPWSREAIRAAWRLLGWNPRIRGGDAPRLLFARCDESPFMNNIGYIFIVRRLGKQSKLILSRLDSISNLELNLRYMAYVAQMLTQEPIYKPSSIFCFKPILLSAHKLTLLIYGDNTHRTLAHAREGHASRRGPRMGFFNPPKKLRPSRDLNPGPVGCRRRALTALFRNLWQA